MTSTKHSWAETFRLTSERDVEASFGSDFGLGDVIPYAGLKPAPSVPSDPNPPSFSDSHPLPHYPFGFDMKKLKNPLAADPSATPAEQRTKDRALLVKVAFGGAGLLALLALLGGGSAAPVSVPTATAPAPRPGNISINLSRFSPFHRKGKRSRAKP